MLPLAGAFISRAFGPSTFGSCAFGCGALTVLRSDGDVQPVAQTVGAVDNDTFSGR